VSIRNIPVTDKLQHHETQHPAVLWQYPLRYRKSSFDILLGPETGGQQLCQ